MTYEEHYTHFLADLAVTPRTWHLIELKNLIHGGIRQGGGQTYRWPLTAVVLLTTGRSVEVYDASAAGMDYLHLPIQLALDLRAAADNYGLPSVRRDLLQACGLDVSVAPTLVEQEQHASIDGCPTH